MTDFDYQWKNLLGKEVLQDMEKIYECNNDRVKEFLKLTGLKSWYSKNFAIGKYRFELDIKSLEPRLYLKLVKGIDVNDAYTFLLAY